MTTTPRAPDYLTALPYPDRFHPEQAPLWLGAVIAALGHVPPAGGAGWCEIGCGRGFGATLLAAANPGLRFTGIDLNPDHIAQAKARADAAGISNLRFLCADIRDLGDDLGRFDQIVTHGLLSWVPPGVRAAVVDFTARHLSPGGLAALHYMAAPGGDVFRAFHAVFRSVADHPDPVAEGMRLLTGLRGAGAGFFALHPHAGQTLDNLLREDPAYVAHEYLNPDFHPLPFASVAGPLAEAGLHWRGSATPVENIDTVSLPAAALPLIRAEADPLRREGLKDLARNQALRSDLFTRPGAAADGQTHLSLLRQMTWGLLPGTPRVGTDDLVFQTRIGAVTGDHRIFGPLFDRLAQGPARFDMLEQLAPFAGRPGLLNQSLQIALWAGFAHPVQRVVDPAPARRLNRLLLARAAAGDRVPALAAPALGSGRRVAPADLADLAAGRGPADLRQLFVLDG